MKRILIIALVALLATSPAFAAKAKRWGDPTEGGKETFTQRLARQNEAAKERCVADPEKAAFGGSAESWKFDFGFEEEDMPQSTWDGTTWNTIRYQGERKAAGMVYCFIRDAETAYAQVNGSPRQAYDFNTAQHQRVAGLNRILQANGGNYTASTGSGTFVNNGKVYNFYRGRPVSVEYLDGNYQVGIDFQNDIMTVRGAGGHVAVNIRTSEFVDANLPLMAQSSSQLLSNTGRGVSFTENATLRVLNDVYAVVEQQKGEPGVKSWPLTEFIFGVMQTDQMRQRVFAMAQKIYAD